MSIPPSLSLYSARFQEKKVAPKLTQELLALEQKLYNLNDTGTKLEKIALFCTNTPFSFHPKTLNQAGFVELLAFFRNIDFITDEQVSQILYDENSVSYFKRYAKKSDASDVEATFFQAAFGGQFFNEFDYTNKTDERAQNYLNTYGDFPIYEVNDVKRRNDLLQKVVQSCLKKGNMKGEPTLQRSFLTETLSDASNSPLMIHFWISEKAILAVKAYCAI
ncbi:MAG: hypothetical protein RL329_88 [Bacteroidota bacterium]|jgi:hypothetical protein